MSDYFDFDPIKEDILKKYQEERNQINSAAGKYCDNNSFKIFTGEDTFDFEKNKKEFIENLNWLKSLSVEEFTLLKKFEEIINLNRFIKDFHPQAKYRIWEPHDIYNEELTIKQIEGIKPKIVVVDDSLDRLWTTLRVYCHTADYSQAPGRCIKYIMVDGTSDKILGISSIASDVISISCRDEFIGWTQEDKLKHKMMKHSAIGTTILPTQPFGRNFLGGKLIAALMTTEKVRNEWENQSDSDSQKCKLIAMTTTSLYGSFSMYNSLKWWKPVGSSKGKITIKPQEKFYKKWHNWLKTEHKEEYEEMITQKEGVSGPITGAKMRILSMIFKYLKIKVSDYNHGYERGVYWAGFYENSKEFLCRKIKEEDLKLKSLYKDDIDGILKWWKPKAVQRYKKLKAENRLNPKKLFYSEINNMNDGDYEKAKQMFLQEVGK